MWTCTQQMHEPPCHGNTYILRTAAAARLPTKLFLSLLAGGKGKGPTSGSGSSAAAAAAAASACFWSPRGRFFCCLASAAGLVRIGAAEEPGRPNQWQLGHRRSKLGLGLDESKP